MLKRRFFVGLYSFLLCSLMILAVFVENVPASISYVTLEEWDSQSVGTSNFTGAYFNFHRTTGTDMKVTNLNLTGDGTKDLSIVRKTSSNIDRDEGNLTAITPIEGVAFFNFSLRIDFKVSTTSTQIVDRLIIFYGKNKTGVNKEWLRFHVIAHSNPYTCKVSFYDYYGVENVLYSGFVAYGYTTRHKLQISVSWEGDTNLARYKCYNKTTMSVYSNYYSSIRSVTHWNDLSLNLILFYASIEHYALTSNDFVYVNFGDLKIAADSMLGESVLCSDMSLFSSVEAFSPTALRFPFVDTPYIENLYTVPMSATVYGVGLLLGIDHYLGDSVLSHYSAKVNGVTIGAPDCFVPYISESYYLLFWDCVVDVSDKTLLFEFYHSQPYGFGHYWELCGVFGNPNVLGHYFNFPKGHNSPGLYNGVYDGEIIWRGPAYIGYSFEMQMGFWYGNFVINDEESAFAADLITTSKAAFHTWDDVPLYYQVKTETYANSIEAWFNGTQLTINEDEYVFPFNIPSGTFNGFRNFIPLHPGSYRFKLRRNSVTVAAVNITVTAPSDSDFVLFVRPNPCDFNAKATIGYRFYPDDGAEGFIGVSTDDSVVNLSGFDYTWAVSANTTGNHSFFAMDNTYIKLFKKTGSSYNKVAEVKLSILNVFGDVVGVRYPSFVLSEASPSFVQTISGTVSSLSMPRVVKVNGKLLADVSSGFFFTLPYPVSSSGYYNVSLCVETRNGTVVLDSVVFIVSGGGEIPGASDAFPPEMKLLFGICCILVAVSCPLMISVKYHVAVPTFVYVVFMAFGIGIGTVLGFLELWLVFLFVVALVAGAVFTIFGHGGSGGGGGGGDSGTIRKGGILSRRGGKDYSGASRKADYGVSPKGSPGYLKGPGRRGY